MFTEKILCGAASTVHVEYGASNGFVEDAGAAAADCHHGIFFTYQPQG